jgi:hypothetical protein
MPASKSGCPKPNERANGFPKPKTASQMVTTANSEQSESSMVRFSDFGDLPLAGEM